MSKQQHVYLRDPDQALIQTTVIDTKLVRSRQLVAVSENLLRAAGGGEPRDLGVLVPPVGDDIPILDVIKRDGLTWMICPLFAGSLKGGDSVTLEIDVDHRNRRRRLHTALHLCLRSILNHFSAMEVKMADISDDASSAMIVVSLQAAVTQSDVSLVDRQMRQYVLQGRKVDAIKMKSIEDADATYGDLLRVSDRHVLKGRVRLIHIDGLDLNPCSGLHYPTSNIGPYTLTRAKSTDANVLSLTIELRNTWCYWFGD